MGTVSLFEQIRYKGDKFDKELFAFVINSIL